MTKSYRKAGGQSAALPTCAVQDREGLFGLFSGFFFVLFCKSVASDLQSRIGCQSIFLALGESLNLSGSGSAPAKWGQLNLTTQKSC